MGPADSTEGEGGTSQLTKCSNFLILNNAAFSQERYTLDSIRARMIRQFQGQALSTGPPLLLRSKPLYVLFV